MCFFTANLKFVPTVVHLSIDRVVLAALAARPTLATGLRDNVQDLGEVLTTGDVLRRLALFISQTPVATGFQKDSRQLSTAHRRSYVQGGIAVLRWRNK